ncbi:unnamed protein product, partial [Ascophyllum nodosum]
SISLLLGTELLGSILFSLSLNFKQMAPSFFFWLLASCMWSTASGTAVGELCAVGNRDWSSARPGVAVALTFAFLWAPFCIFSGAASGGTCLSSLGQ